MMMALAPNWKEIVRKAWSVRLILLAGLLSGVEAVMPFIDDAMPRGVFAVASLLVTGAAFVARILAQRGFDDVRGAR
jgi:hypothetical protein